MADEGSSFPDVDGASQNVIPNDQAMKVGLRIDACHLFGADERRLQ